MNLDEYTNDKAVDEKMSGKRKRLDTLNEKVTMPKEPNIEKPRMV